MLHCFYNAILLFESISQRRFSNLEKKLYDFWIFVTICSEVNVESLSYSLNIKLRLKFSGVEFLVNCK